MRAVEVKNDISININEEVPPGLFLVQESLQLTRVSNKSKTYLLVVVVAVRSLAVLQRCKVLFARELAHYLWVEPFVRVVESEIL